MSRVVVQRDGGENLRWCGVLTLGFRNMVGDSLAVLVRFYGVFLGGVFSHYKYNASNAFIPIPIAMRKSAKHYLV